MVDPEKIFAQPSLLCLLLLVMPTWVQSYGTFDVSFQTSLPVMEYPTRSKMVTAATLRDRSHSSSSHKVSPTQHVLPTVLRRTQTYNTQAFVDRGGPYDPYQHHHGSRGPPPLPHLAVNNETSQTFLGEMADIACTLHNPGELSVSWMRQVGDLLELITYDDETYANDDRYSLETSEGEGWKRWRLLINSTRRSDAGLYRCRVATSPPLVQDVALDILAPRSRVVDERGSDVSEKHYNSGSMIQLKCLVDRVPFPHGKISWRKGSTVLTFNTSIGGISVKGDTSTGLVTSRLYVANATPRDSGVYSCWYKEYAHDNVTVHVIAGEYPAAMQHDSLPESAVPSSSSNIASGGQNSGRVPLALLLGVVLLQVLFACYTGRLQVPVAAVTSVSVAAVTSVSEAAVTIVNVAAVTCASMAAVTSTRVQGLMISPVGGQSPRLPTMGSAPWLPSLAR